MRITSITLGNFIPFRNSDINILTATFNSPVQVIMGSNGSGKSSLYRSLSVTPPVKSMFNKDGYKSISIEKDGIVYRLDSEFNKSSPRHSFYEADSEENLNQGYTVEVQKELILEHLGITPIIDDLIMNRYRFPEWSGAERRKFIMANNPDQINFVLSLLKQTSSKIRAARNNLSRLQSRKMLLEQDLLSDEIIQDLSNEKLSIDNELSQFQKYLMDIEVGLRTIGDPSPPSINFEEMKNTIRLYTRRLSKLSHVDRDDTVRANMRDRFIGDQGSYRQKLSTMEDDILSISQILNDDEARYRELAPEDIADDIDITISRLENERDRLFVSPPPFELSKDELERRYSELDKLQEVIQSFSDLDIPLYTSAKRARRTRVLENANCRLSSTLMSLSDLRSRLESISKRHSVSLSDIPDNPCAKHKCPLFSIFSEEYTHAAEEKEKISRSISILSHKESRLHILINGLTSYFQKSNYYHEKIQWIVTYAQSNPVLHHILRQCDILNTLSTAPNVIIMRIKDAYDHIEKYIRLKSVISDLDTAYTLKKRQISSESHDIVNLVVSIENNKKALYELRNGIESIFTELSLVNKHLEDINTFDDVKKTIFSIRDTHQNTIRIISNNYDHSRLSFVKEAIGNVRSLRFSRLSEIERTIRAQDLLRSRYTEEVLSELSRITKEISDQEQIEKALIAIPKESTICFINDIFEQANLIIASVWTIPLSIDLLSMDDSLTYDFTVTSDNEASGEMSVCSDGQKEIISLAINLALRIYLEHLNLPLCLDEPGRTMDETHKDNLMTMLKGLLDEGVISQLFMVSHHASMHESLTDSETLVMREDNVLVPATFNTHVKIS